MSDVLLQDEIDKVRRQIKTDNYQMSIGELANLYRDGDLNIKPIYQRLFRWDISQQSALIESILLGIPVPPIYVFQEKSGKWDLIDGLQRLATIFKFMGILKSESANNFVEPEALIKTKFLKALDGKFWSSSKENNSLSDGQRRFIKRAKLTVIIIDQDSDDFFQYEMFQRLNTGGTHLSSQEIRNCILIAKDQSIYETFCELSKYISYVKSLPLSPKEKKEQVPIDFVIRYFVLKYSDLCVSDSENYSTFITNEILNIIDSGKLSFQKDIIIFKKTFDLLSEILGKDAFKKYSAKSKKHTGPKIVGAFEAIIPGVIDNLSYYEKNKDMLIKKIQELYYQKDYLQANEHGVRPVGRLKKLVKFSRKYFVSE